MTTPSSHIVDFKNLPRMMKIAIISSSTLVLGLSIYWFMIFVMVACFATSRAAQPEALKLALPFSLRAR